MSTSSELISRLVQTEVDAATAAETRDEFYMAFTKLECAHVHRAQERHRLAV